MKWERPREELRNDCGDEIAWREQTSSAREVRTDGLSLLLACLAMYELPISRMAMAITCHRFRPTKSLWQRNDLMRDSGAIAGGNRLV